MTASVKFITVNEEEYHVETLIEDYHRLKKKSRASGHGCPICAGHVATTDDNLLVKYPDIAKEWHPTLNGELLPSEVKSRSGKKVWWKCGEGHEWQARIQGRVRIGTSCPHCAREK